MSTPTEGAQKHAIIVRLKTAHQRWIDANKRMSKAHGDAEQAVEDYDAAIDDLRTIDPDLADRLEDGDAEIDTL